MCNWGEKKTEKKEKEEPTRTFTAESLAESFADFIKILKNFAKDPNMKGFY